MNSALLSSKDMNWCTPISLFEILNKEFHFDLDAAATERSAKCKHYFTPEDDGLIQNWGGKNVFCNPPYGREIGEWVKKGFEESRKENTTVVMLIPARPDTRYWHEYILNGIATEVRFIKGRLRFTDEEGREADPAPFPSAVVIWKSPDLERRTTNCITMNNI